MMNKFNLSAASKALLTAGVLSLAVTGCGSDGKDGNDGNDGVVGVSIDNAKSLNAIFTNATVDAGAVTVDFKLENDNGVAVLGLTKDHDLRFGIAQLTHVTELMGEEEVDRGFQWQAYINTEKAPNEDWIPEDESHINPSKQFQAEVEKASNCETCFVDNGDGSYTYTFQQNIADVTAPVAVAYNAEFTQRATLELELPKFAANAHFDWQPSTGMTDGIQTRNVVAIETCYTCHQPESLAFHGGRRIDIENCASCHTATSGDPESGNSVDFTYMIHAIHKGSERMISTAEGMVPAPYKVIGYGGGVHDYGDVEYPQNPAADCTACHVEGDNAPANADLFKADLSNTACIGCHTEKPSSNHSSTNCMACHNATDTYPGTGNAEKRHGDVMKRYLDSQNYSAKFTNVKVTGNALTFDVQILDGNGEPVAKEFIANPSKYTKSSIYFSWDIDKDYPAYTDTSKYSARGFALTNTDVSTYNETTKTFSIDSTNSKLGLPSDLEGKSVELFAGVATCFKSSGYGVAEVVPAACEYDADKPDVLLNPSAYIQDQPLRFTWNGTDTNEAAKVRRSIIDEAKCTSCHNQEIVHYGNGVNCQACHTSDKGLSETYWGSGKFVPTNFAYKAHKAEGHYTGTVVKSDCATCHAADDKTGKLEGIALGRAPGRVWQDVNAAGEAVWASSDAGACLTCHRPTDPWFKESTRAHIETNGGVLDALDKDTAINATESCATCHSPEQIVTAHGH